MAKKDKSAKRKHKEKADPKELEDKGLTEQKEESTELPDVECGADRTERKKLKKSQLSEQLVDSEDNKNNNIEESYEELDDKNVDKAVVWVEKQRRKKSKKTKSKEKKIIEETNEENGSEDKGIKVLHFGQYLSANIATDRELIVISLKRTTESTETTFDMTAKEWKAFKEVVPQIDDLINNTSNDDNN